MPVSTSSIAIAVGGEPRTPGRGMPPEQLRSLQSAEVEAGVNEQAMFRVRIAMGQDSGGDWARYGESTYQPGSRITITARVGNKSARLINGVLTQFKSNFRADPCESQLELVGMDALEKLKRKTSARSRSSQPLQTMVTNILQGHSIDPPSSGVPNAGQSNPNREVTMQPQNDLEFLRALAEQHNCELYVDPEGDRDQGQFRPLDFGAAARIDTAIQVQRGANAHVRNGSFYYDLTGPTAVEAQFIDAQGKAAGSPVKVALRDRLSGEDKALLGPPGWDNVKTLERHGRETQSQLQRLCEAELDKLSWVVIGKGDLETSTYGDILLPRRKVDVQGAGTAFNGTYLVWKVAHLFTRDSYCQRFELRRKLGVR